MIKKDSIVKGWGELQENIDYEKLASFKIISNEDDGSEQFLSLLKNNNSLEIINLDVSDLIQVPKFIDNI